MYGKLYGIGVGPGDPELITLKAKRLLENTDIIAIPKSSRGKDSLALQIAKEIIGDKKEILELDFPMSYDSKVLSDSWNMAADKVIEILVKGKDIAFITLGDPGIYSTYMYLHKIIIEKGFDAEIIPGVTSFCASAAFAGINLTEGKETLAIIPSAYENEKLSDIIDAFDNIVLMKSAKALEDINTILKSKGLNEKAVIINNCGLEDESIEYSLNSEKIKDFGYFTTTIVKKKGVK